ncbi:MAG: PAS domain-containing protein [Elusimicrobia bacterium]|nr:PAS domain-containing protein [Elusimicrobiota bacterium]
MLADIPEAFIPLFNAIPDGICISDRRSRATYANPAAEMILGGFPREKTRRTVCTALCGRLFAQGGGDCRSHCPLRDARSRETEVSFQGRYGPKGKHLRVRCFRLDSGKNEKHFTLIEDVTVQTNCERRREGWRSMLEHDIRSPLTVVLTALVCLAESPNSWSRDAEEKELLSIALQGARRMAKLLENDLDLARLAAGKMPMSPETVSIGELLAKCVEMQEPMARAKRITVKLQADASIQATADSNLLFRVAQNLLDNALKFTPESGAVEIRAEYRRESVRLSFKDTGPGIAAEHVPLLFERYYQAEARNGKASGTGLGLAFCREALAAMGGGIQVKSLAGQGSEFIVTLAR